MAFERMCGVKIVKENEFLIKPCVGGTTKHASLEWQSIYGLIKTSWEKINNQVKFKISVPSNTYVNFEYNDIQKRLEQGDYEFLI